MGTCGFHPLVVAFPFICQGGDENQTGSPALDTAFSPLAYSQVTTDNQTTSMTIASDKTFPQPEHLEDTTGDDDNADNQCTDMTQDLTLTIQTDDLTIEPDRLPGQTEVTEMVLPDDEQSGQDASSVSMTPPTCSPLSDVCELQMETPQEWYGFKIVGDNIDKNVRPSFQRVDHQTQSLHHFHSIAVRDRIDLSAFSNSVPAAQLIHVNNFLLSAADILLLERDFEVLVSRLVHFSYTSKACC